MSLAVITERIGIRRESALETYRDLVRRVFAGHELDDGHDPDDAEVERVLDQADKSLTDLQADVQLFATRRGLHAKLEEAAAMDFDGIRQIIEAEKMSLQDALLAARSAHDNGLLPLIAREAELDRISKGATLAERELRRTASPELQARARTCSEQLQALSNKKGELTELLNKARVTLGQRLSQVEPKRHDAELDARIAGVQKRIDEYETGIADAENEIAQTVEQGKRIAAEMLHP